MLASAGGDAPSGGQWVFEPKYDGIRIVAIVMGDSVGMITRNGHDKCRQFPEITDCLRDLARKIGRPLVLDGEVVALDPSGRPARLFPLSNAEPSETGSRAGQLLGGAPRSRRRIPRIGRFA